MFQAKNPLNYQQYEIIQSILIITDEDGDIRKTSNGANKLQNILWGSCSYSKKIAIVALSSILVLLIASGVTIAVLQPFHKGA